jgi:hypothetical protein
MAQRLPPGFRFHPTDVELVAYYLKEKINGRPIEMNPIAVVDLYKCEPWDLPGMCLFEFRCEVSRRGFGVCEFAAVSCSYFLVVICRQVVVGKQRPGVVLLQRAR